MGDSQFIHASFRFLLYDNSNRLTAVYIFGHLKYWHNSNAVNHIPPIKTYQIFVFYFNFAIKNELNCTAQILEQTPH